MFDNSPIAVIFDMDGVLVDSASPHLESWKKLAEEHGKHVTERQFVATFGRQNRDIIPILFGPVTDKQLADLGDRKEEIYRELVRGKLPIVEGAVELIKMLSQKGARLAVGSSGPLANIDLVLSEMEVRECFHAIVSADDVTRGKPDPQVFQLAASRLDVPPSRCVVIEDAPSGVQAARAAGTRTAAIMLHHSEEKLQPADLVVRRLADLTADMLMDLATANR